MGRLWKKNHDEEQMRKAVEKGWITPEDFEEITGIPY